MAIYDFDLLTTEILQHGTQLLKLVDLTYVDYSHSQTITLMESLHRICPNLAKISICTADHLPFEAIQALLKCPALVEIISEGCIFMGLEDIVTVATNRPSWQVINLTSTGPLSYQALIPFAQNCPDLYRLGLKLDSKLGIPDPTTFTTDVKFSSLTSLGVGGSEPTPDFELTLFLSKICSKPIKIIDHYSREWRTFEKLVNFHITTQLEIRTLKEEIMLLRTQKCNNDS
ncbi:hypothetical protein Clacol_002116 [Clathrus columnatus]|uniref:Uncharacterized protein n=1 Tax=Clathrus columnatus TaxID=1419009 RepID=A0AAV5A4H1_9AGAM|nr:hypothetical protein Clacol_002116 [Clathrus columnatus]